LNRSSREASLIEIVLPVTIRRILGQFHERRLECGVQRSVTPVASWRLRYSAHVVQDLRQSTPKFFRSAAAFRKWLLDHHDTAQELLVGFYKTDSGKPSITWPESVDEALCFGWIDGIRKRVDDVSYTIRFTPRKTGSIWSTVNTRKTKALIDQGRMMPSGLKAFAARREDKSGLYSHEQRPESLIEPYAAMLARNSAASTFFQRQAASYRRAAIWWVISAKRDETRLKRALKLIELSASGELIPQFIRKPVHCKPAN
jgi:uncharacterized protein YdeI (YjbR/CyaY-like superfamily)